MPTVVAPQLLNDGRSGKTENISVLSMTALMNAVDAYFDLMYDFDTSKLFDVFYRSSHLHGFRDGRMVSWSMDVYKDVLSKRKSPKSLSSVREEEVLLVDFAAPTQAIVKVRVRISETIFVDHLTWHLVDGKWLITSKGFHAVSRET